MAVVALEGIRFYGYHGVYDEEAKAGTYYTMDVEVGFNLIDQMSRPVINYESIYSCCKASFESRQALLENIVLDIASKLERRHPEMKSLKIRLAKENPPLGGEVQRAVITLDETY